MSIRQPQPSDFLNTWNHALSHRVFANDDSSPVKSIVVDSAGRVGFGVETPTNALSLENSASKKFWIENSATDVVGRDLTVASGGTILGTSVDNVVGGKLILQSGLGTGTGASTISLQTGTTLTTGKTLQSMSTKMTILGNGNVGIGTTSPTQTLEVNGAVKISDNSFIGNGNNAGFFFSDGVNNAYKYGFYRNGSTIGFRINSDSDQVTFDSSGNVGIGTTSPTNLLSLGGNAARKFWMERHTTANTAGNTLTIQSGSATVGATDKDGGMLTLSPGASTGTGKVSVRTQRLSRASSTGTSDNSLYDAEIVPSVLNLTDASATSLFEVALATLAMAGGSIEYTINATDGTDMQSLSGVVTYSAVNKGGVYTTQITENTNNRAVANSSGTLTASWSILEGTNKITIQLTADSSLTPTSMKLYYKLHNGSSSAITQL